ncbi:MAG: hypothetical protein QGG40_03935, partial [Myxococcota bacterium]|jgi:ElaB/YqjD/DUF883 family membrane-anchored ribosome-binding protein|nr:hypothetical protein [Myxococcota bacterium]
VVFRGPDGSTALRVVEWTAEVQAGIDKAMEEVQAVKAFLLDSGDVVAREELDALRSELETRLAEAQEAAEQAARNAAQAPVGSAVAVAQGADAPVATGPAGRGFPVPDLSSVQPDRSGSMDGLDYAHAVIGLATERSTGVLTIRLPDEIVRYGFWSNGGPVGWRTDPLQESEVLGMLLFRAKQIGKEQLAKSLELMEQRGCRQGDALIELGVLSFPQLLMVLSKQTEFIFQRTLETTAGDWTFHGLPQLPEKFVAPAVPAPSVMFRRLVDIAKKMDSGELKAQQLPQLDLYVFTHDQLATALNVIKFAKGEAKLVEILQAKSWRLRELISVSPMARTPTVSAIWALDQLGFLDFRESEDVGRYLERVGSRVRQKKAQVAQCSLFDVLEVHWICLPGEVEAAYRRLHEEFDVSGYHDLSSDLQGDIRICRKAVEEAYQRLRHEGSRREYRAELIEEVKIFQSAELLSKKGEMAIMKHDGKDARMCFGKALELIPGNAAYRDGLTRATTL